MDAVYFPELSKQPRVNLPLDYEDSTLRSKMENGLVLTRAPFPRVRRTWTVTYSPIPQADFDKLDDFIRNTVMVGAASFRWTHPLTSEEVCVRISKAPKITPVGWVAGGIGYSAELTLEEV
jgi:hypothetical protein